MRHRPLVFTLAAAVTLLTSTALADVPGPKPKCDAEGKGCETCWRPYGGSDDAGTSPYKQCADPLTAKGLIEACAHRQGAGDQVYFCPAGVKVQTRIVGGCAGCAIGSEAEPWPLALAAGLAVAALWRARRAARG